MESGHTLGVPSSGKDGQGGYSQVSSATEDAALKAMNNYKPTNDGWVGKRNPWDDRLS